MPDTLQSVDLTPLGSDYTIVGELGGSSNCRTLLAERKTDDAKRRDDHTGVIISIYCNPEGDEANALSHLAADTKLLAAEGHRRLVPIIEGVWLGDNHFAVVTQRITDPNIAQRLASREVFSTVRIAAILRELNGLLEWARDQGVVHRIITGQSVYLEPRTDRVRVMFDVTPIHRVRPPDETRDGRTIARLAMAMLAGVDDPDACSVDNLHEMRPELPARLAEATAELLDVKNAKTKTDIVNYIALIGMSDPLYRGEEEEKRIRAEILEEQRAEREKLANERTDFETHIAKERADFEALMKKERADFEALMKKEKAELDAAEKAERERLEAERLALQKAASEERAKLQKAMAQERAELAAKRTDMEKAVAAQKAELERVASLDRKQIEDLRADLKRRGEAEIERKRQIALEEVEDYTESELDEEELAPPIFIGPNLVPLEALTFSDDNEVLKQEPIVFERERLEEEAERTLAAKHEKEHPATRNRWLIPGAVGGGVATLALAALLFANKSDRAPSTPVQPSRPVAVVTPPGSGPALPQSVVPLPSPSQIIDSAGGTVAGTADSGAARSPIRTPEEQASFERAAAARERQAARDRQAARERAAQRRSELAADSLFNFRSPPRRDSVAPPRRDSVAPVRPDTVTPPDSARLRN